MAGFTYKYNLFGLPPVTKDVVINNSITVTIGDMVYGIDGNLLALAVAGSKILGVVTGIISSDGVPLDRLTAGTDYDGTYTAGGVNVGNYVASADNSTDKLIKARVLITPGEVFSGTPDATIGTTTGSDSIGYVTDLADEDQVDENTAAANTTNTAQLAILGLDPENTSNGLYTIFERQII